MIAVINAVVLTTLAVALVVALVTPQTSPKVPEPTVGPKPPEQVWRWPQDDRDVDPSTR